MSVSSRSRKKWELTSCSPELLVSSDMAEKNLIYKEEMCDRVCGNIHLALLPRGRGLRSSSIWLNLRLSRYINVCPVATAVVHPDQGVDYLETLCGGVLS